MERKLGLGALAGAGLVHSGQAGRPAWLEQSE